MRPMKGTAARGRTVAEDEEIVARLRSSPKERAENVMIVDLVRNDLARVASTGSVTVPRLLHAERFETVHQLTSDVTARLRPDAGLTAIFRALFPCGSVTGAPKPRTMELIRDVEDSARGRVLRRDRRGRATREPPFRARFSVAIRTVLIDRDHGTATYGTGGGITWGSRPEAEYAELLAKARVLDARPQDFHLIETMRHERGRGPTLTRRPPRADDSLADLLRVPLRRRRRPDRPRRTARRRRATPGSGCAATATARSASTSRQLPLSGRRTGAPGDRPGADRLTQCWPHHKTSRASRTRPGSPGTLRRRRASW